MYICIYIYIYKYIFMYIYIYDHVCMYVRPYVRFRKLFLAWRDLPAGHGPRDTLIARLPCHGAMAICGVSTVSGKLHVLRLPRTMAERPSGYVMTMAIYKEFSHETW